MLQLIQVYKKPEKQTHTHAKFLENSGSQISSRSNVILLLWVTLGARNTFFYTMEKIDFSPISCRKAPFYIRNRHFENHVVSFLGGIHKLRWQDFDDFWHTFLFRWQVYYILPGVARKSLHFKWYIFC